MSDFSSDPRSFALELVENGIVTADHLLMCALKYMSTDDVRDLLDCNELSPRFDEDEDENETCIDCGSDDIEEGTCKACQAKDWVEGYFGKGYDTDAMTADIANNNLTVGDDDGAAEYAHENIVMASIRNGQLKQAWEQSKKFGFEHGWFEMTLEHVLD